MKKDRPIRWNPFNKVVQDHRDGSIYIDRTNRERAKRGLPVPWSHKMNEATHPPVY